MTDRTTVDPRPLAGQRAIVSGASRGIGRHLALALAAAGADVALGARDADSLEVARQEVQALGVSALALPLDVASASSIRRFIDSAVDGLGGLDILVNNAGVLTAGSLLNDGDAPWTRAMDTNVLGTVRMTEAAGRTLTSQGHGKVVNIASNFAFKGVPHHAAYCASKAAVVSFTRSIAVEWARHGIQVNAIAPGYFATSMNADVREDPDVLARVVRAIPIRRMGEPRELRPWLLLLAGEESNFMTGEVIVIDGGQSIR